MELKCARCGKKLDKKKYMLQEIIYLGNIGKRMDVCENCFNEFEKWINNYKEENNG